MSSLTPPAEPLAYASPEGDAPTPYDVLLGHIDEVIGEWRALAAGEPWGALPPDRLVDSFPELLPQLFRLARAGATHIDGALSERIAEAHGHFRRQDSVPLAAIAEEWSFVKRSCWKVLRRHLGSPDEMSVALHRLDALVDDAIGYTLRGYYAPELDTLRGRGLERRGNAPERRSLAGDRRAR